MDGEYSGSGTVSGAERRLQDMAAELRGAEFAAAEVVAGLRRAKDHAGADLLLMDALGSALDEAETLARRLGNLVKYTASGVR